MRGKVGDVENRPGLSSGLARVVNGQREGKAVHFVPAYMPNLSLGPATNSGAFLLVQTPYSQLGEAPSTQQWHDPCLSSANTLTF